MLCYRSDITGVGSRITRELDIQDMMYRCLEIRLLPSDITRLNRFLSRSLWAAGPRLRNNLRGQPRTSQDIMKTCMFNQITALCYFDIDRLRSGLT